MSSRGALAGMISVGILAFAVANPAVAQNPKQAATDVSQVDDDFAYQGEYSGQLVKAADGGWTSKKYGLQVVTHGSGQFIGKLYPGGLPGSGWNREESMPLAGVRTGENLELLGEELRVVISDGRAKLASLEKQLVGELKKVKRESPTLGKKPPSDATVIFGGSITDYLKGARITEDGLLQEGVELTKLASDFQLHLEFRLPYMPYARGQQRSNSGVYLHKRYEVQVLDSFGLDGAFNEAGALYREHKPLLNMCLPPLQWQTYDISFTAPRFDQDGNKTDNAKLTVLLNGVPVQKNLDLATPTGGGKRVGEGPNPLPINLQNHGNPVRFRNIWMVDYTDKKDASASTPVAQSKSSSVSMPAVSVGNPYGNYWPNSFYPGGMVPAGVAPGVWGW